MERDADDLRGSSGDEGQAVTAAPGVDRVFGTCSEHGRYELPLASVERGEIPRRCPGCVDSQESQNPGDHADLIRRARETWQSLFLMSYHGTSWGGECADLTEKDVNDLRGLIRELAAALAMETGVSLSVE